MDDHAGVAFARTGDADSFRFSDDEYIEGMTLTQHLYQLKLFTAIAATAFIGASATTGNLALASDGWMKGGCGIDGRCNFQKVISKDWPYVIYTLSGTDGMFTKQADCRKLVTRYINDDGSKTEWRHPIAGTVGETDILNVCR